MRRVLALHPEDNIDVSSLEDSALTSSPATLDGPAPSEAQSLIVPSVPMRRLERQLVEQTLLQTSGNRTRAAELLGISVRTIRNRIREYGLPPRRYA